MLLLFSMLKKKKKNHLCSSFSKPKFFALCHASSGVSRGSFLCKTVVLLRFMWQAWVKFKLLWFNPFGAAALNHCSCCWHSQPTEGWERMIEVYLRIYRWKLRQPWTALRGVCLPPEYIWGMSCFEHSGRSLTVLFPLEINCPQGRVIFQNIQ